MPSINVALGFFSWIWRLDCIYEDTTHLAFRTHYENYINLQTSFMWSLSLFQNILYRYNIYKPWQLLARQGMHTSAIMTNMLLQWQWTSFKFDLRYTQLRGNHAHYFKCIHISEANEIMNLGWESTTVTFLKNCNSLEHWKHYPYMTCTDKYSYFHILKKLF